MTSNSSHSSNSDQNQAKYELLSAYLDQEANAAERRQVEQWLDTDPEFETNYRQWLKLRAYWQAMPIPTPEYSGTDLARRVFQIIGRRTRRTVFWGGTAIAALLVAAFSGSILDNGRVPLLVNLEPETSSEPLKIALNEPIVPEIDPEALSISVDQPIIAIPKAPTDDVDLGLE
ncbi:MAG: anti-sigma factor family protein [Microcoleaceae cyanobacterium]